MSEHGTRECWLEGCSAYICLIAADIDPVKIERRLDPSLWSKRPTTADRILTADEAVELKRHKARQRSNRDCAAHR